MDGLINKTQAIAMAKKHPAFNSAKLVLVDANGNMRFDPADGEYENLSQNEVEVFVVKGDLGIKEEAETHKED